MGSGESRGVREVCELMVSSPEQELELIVSSPEQELELIVSSPEQELDAKVLLDERL
jgi:hypothetical protein